MSVPLVSVRNLTVRFRMAVRRELTAVDNVSLDISAGETLGLVGESGCGKTTLGRAVLRLVPLAEGEVRYRGALVEGDMTPFRRRMQMIFQDPYASLDPRMSAGSIVAEPIRALGLLRGAHVRTRVEELMVLVGLDPRLLHRYPHEFSGGQRQRIAIARALAAAPDFIVADEPLSALDVSVQAHILNLLASLQAALGLTYLFISHDLRAVYHIADRIAVMYLGQIVELGSAVDVVERPLAPYTRALIAAMPPAPESAVPGRRLLIDGDPSRDAPPSGCPFYPRCRYAISECASANPALREIEPRHWAACLRIGPREPDVERAAEKGIRVQA